MALLERLIVYQLVKNSLSFYGTWKFIVVLIRAREVFYLEPDQPTPSPS
jgi:hypothetical protein